MSKLKTFTIITAIAAIAGASYFVMHQSGTKKTDGVSGSNNPGTSQGLGGSVSNRPVTVVTTLARQRDYPVRLLANGVISPINTVDIRSQVTSTVSKVHIREGQFVRTGDLLFTLDSRTDEVNLAKAQAQLNKDLATMADFQRQLERSKDLHVQNFVSKSAIDTSLTLVQTQEAVLASDKAAVTAARVALSFNRILAPSAGRTGIISVYPGSLVLANATALPLVTITQMDPISITFPLPQRNLPDALASMRNGQQKTGGDSFVTATLPDSKTEFKGKIGFVDNAVDATSGTLKVKAIFDNKELRLWPGAFVNVELSVETLKAAVVVPLAAIIIGARQSSVYLIDAQGKASLQPVVVTNSFGLDAVVTGIEAGARVVLEGKQNLRPGVMVNERPSEVKGAAAKPAKGGAVESSVAAVPARAL
jgi:RND family efflux transporter MFP subunit